MIPVPFRAKSSTLGGFGGVPGRSELILGGFWGFLGLRRGVRRVGCREQNRNPHMNDNLVAACVRGADGSDGDEGWASWWWL